MAFSSLGLSASLLEALRAQNFAEPTPIQNEAIPAIIAGKDLLGISKTGSGKTASYVLPILQALTAASAPREPQVLVLLPTRELADQVYQVIVGFLSAIDGNYSCRAVYGGVSVNPQMKALAKVDLLVATPGRLLDLVGQNAVSLGSVKTLVLDEADKMLAMGFQKEVDALIDLLPRKRQSLLFSATLSPTLQEVQRVLLMEPLVVEIDSDEEEVELIRQVAYAVADEKKGPLLRHLIRERDTPQTLVFASSAVAVDRVVNKLRKNKIQALGMHSKLSQQARREALQDFQEGLFPVLVATDLLSRGVDIDSLPCVINYDLPRSPKDYVHRIGRTGRAGSPGEAISLISPDEEHHFKVIQKKMGARVPLLDGSDLV